MHSYAIKNVFKSEPVTPSLRPSRLGLWASLPCHCRGKGGSLAISTPCTVCGRSGSLGCWHIVFKSPIPSVCLGWTCEVPVECVGHHKLKHCGEKKPKVSAPGQSQSWLARNTFVLVPCVAILGWTNCWTYVCLTLSSRGSDEVARNSANAIRAACHQLFLVDIVWLDSQLWAQNMFNVYTSYSFYSFYI